MPLREFECDHCGFRVERIEYSTGEPPWCPRCEAEIDRLLPMTKVISVPASPQFVGEGWAKDGYSRPQRGPR